MVFITIFQDSVPDDPALSKAFFMVRPPRRDERVRTDGYVKVTSLKSIETISMSVMGLRSGPRV